MSQVDTLNRVPSLGKPLVSSIVIHSAVAGLFLVTWIYKKPLPQFGDPKISHGTTGIVSVMKRIPIPQRDGRINRLANDTKSIVPQAPPEKKQVAKAIQPDPKAIPLPGKPVKPQVQKVQQPVYKPEPFKPNQAYSHTAAALKSPDLGMQGNEGIGVGPNSTLGLKFGYYVDLMRGAISKHWSTAGLGSDNHRVLITFSILRDGTVRDAKIAQASGNYALDTSALRAVLESNPLPQLPQGYEKDSAPVELWFQAKQ